MLLANENIVPMQHAQRKTVFESSTNDQFKNEQNLNNESICNLKLKTKPENDKKWMNFKSSDLKINNELFLNRCYNILVSDGELLHQSPSNTFISPSSGKICYRGKWYQIF